MKAKPQEHKTEPFCPENIKDDKEKGGIWFKDGKVYDVDGQFIANLDEFYSDPNWKLYREDGTVRVSDTKARGHIDEIIGCFRGQTGSSEVSE